MIMKHQTLRISSLGNCSKKHGNNYKSDVKLNKMRMENVIDGDVVGFLESASSMEWWEGIRKETG